MKSKKEDTILFINYNAYPCVVGGLEVFNLYLINELSKTCNAHILTFCENTKHNKDVKVHVIKQSKFAKLTTPLKTFLFIFKHRKEVQLVHISYTFAFWTHYLIHVIVKKIIGIDYMVTIHDGNLADWKPSWPYKTFFRQAAKVTGVSDRIIKEYGERTGREDIIFTPPLIPFNIILPKNKFRVQWNIKPEEKVLLYVGSLKPLKSVETLIEALGIISSKKLKEYKLKILIAGDGVSRKELEHRAAELNLQKQVSFLGNIKTEEIAELYNIADFFTLCSEYEGLPIVMLEAFANRLPCITSDAPGLHNISEDNKNTILFKTKDSADYADKIEMVLNNPKLQIQLKENGHFYYKDLFSYEDFIENFKMIITTN